MKKYLLIIFALQFLFMNQTYGQVTTDTSSVLNLKPAFTPIIAITKSNIISTLRLSNESMEKIKETEVHSPSMAHTAFFCKLEDKLSKNAKLPIRMGLGDIRYVDVMEGKRKELVPVN